MSSMRRMGILTVLSNEVQKQVKYRKEALTYAKQLNTDDVCEIMGKMGGVPMADSKLRDQSMDFAVAIINLVKRLKEKRETVIANQIGRSGTSIGANIREAQYAHGKADFIAKLQIALKEASETGYWLELLYKTDYISEAEYKSLDAACAAIRVMLISSINTAKGNGK